MSGSDQKKWQTDEQFLRNHGMSRRSLLKGAAGTAAAAGLGVLGPLPLVRGSVSA